MAQRQKPVGDERTRQHIRKGRACRTVRAPPRMRTPRRGEALPRALSPWRRYCARRVLFLRACPRLSRIARLGPLRRARAGAEGPVRRAHTRRALPPARVGGVRGVSQQRAAPCGGCGRSARARCRVVPRFRPCPAPGPALSRSSCWQATMAMGGSWLTHLRSRMPTPAVRCARVYVLPLCLARVSASPPCALVVAGRCALTLQCVRVQAERRGPASAACCP